MIIGDTGLWLALANARDRYHSMAKRATSELDEEIVTTWPVLTETCHLLSTRLGTASAVRFMASVGNGTPRVFDLQRGHVPRVIELMKKYAELPMDLADASLVVLAEQLGSGRILSTDKRDFRAYRWKQRKPFRNLLKLD